MSKRDEAERASAARVAVRRLFDATSESDPTEQFTVFETEHGEICFRFTRGLHAMACSMMKDGLAISLANALIVALAPVGSTFKQLAEHAMADPGFGVAFLDDPSHVPTFSTPPPPPPTSSPPKLVKTTKVGAASELEEARPLTKPYLNFDRQYRR